jgi:hypothetical protein
MEAAAIALSRKLGYDSPSRLLRRSDFLNLVSTWRPCMDHAAGKDGSYMYFWRSALMLAPVTIELHQGHEFQGGLPAYLIAKG